jgi:hypothetical protein
MFLLSLKLLLLDVQIPEWLQIPHAQIVRHLVKILFDGTYDAGECRDADLSHIARQLARSFRYLELHLLSFRVVANPPGVLLDRICPQPELGGADQIMAGYTIHMPKQTVFVIGVGLQCPAPDMAR